MLAVSEFIKFIVFFSFYIGYLHLSFSKYQIIYFCS